MTKFLYYPGCSMETSARAYAESLGAICAPLGLELQEIHDWNCCGATEYTGISLTPAYSLIGRNLALAAAQANGTETLVASCSACYLNLAKTDHYMSESPVLGRRVNDALSAGGLSYQAGSIKVRHLLDVLINDVGLDRVRASVVKPLRGMRVAPYLGCMVPRPDPDKRWSNHERPSELDQLLEALGADVVPYPLKTECCGGHMTQISPKTGFELIRRLVDGAQRAGADIMATVCPMCQINIDAYQPETNHFFGTRYKMPIVFFTQLMGVAFGLEPAKVGFGRELVDARPALAKIGTGPEPEPVAPMPKRGTRPKGPALPMPQMPEGQEVAR